MNVYLSCFFFIKTQFFSNKNKIFGRYLLSNIGNIFIKDNITN